MITVVDSSTSFPLFYVTLVFKILFGPSFIIPRPLLPVAWLGIAVFILNHLALA
jgi:hypothetical protein